MKKILLVSMRYFVSLIFILFFSFCSSKKENTVEQNISDEKVESEESEIDDYDEDKAQAFNDSITKVLNAKYPLALNLDTITNCYTYHFRELLEKSSNILLIENAIIQDIDKQKAKYYISIYTFYPELFGTFYVDEEQSYRLNDLLMSDYKSVVRQCLIVRVDYLNPISNDIDVEIDDFTLYDDIVTEDDIYSYVQLELSPRYRTKYFIKGELIEIIY